MKKILVSLLCLAGLYSFAACEQGGHSYNSFKGMVDSITPDKLSDEYSPSALNVYTDEDNSIRRRRGYIKFNSSALTGTTSVRKLYRYVTTASTEYLIALSSKSVYAFTADSNYSTIITTASETIDDDYCTVKGSLYRDNGVTKGKWNGTTYTDINITNSTNCPSGLYIKYFNNRLFKAGVSSYRNIVYYSEVNDPDNFAALNYINIAVDDGDQITGMFIWRGKLLVFKKYSTWEIVEISAGSFITRQLSDKVGCLYYDTISEYQGYPIWLSHRGVELYDGTFNLVSSDINNFMTPILRDLANSGSLTLDSASDWISGSLLHIDTTTYTNEMTIIANSSYSLESFNYRNDKFDYLRQTICNTGTEDVILKSFNYTQYQIGSGAGAYTSTIFHNIYDTSYNLLYETTVQIYVPKSTNITYNGTITLDPQITLLPNTSYYCVIKASQNNSYYYTAYSTDTGNPYMTDFDLSANYNTGYTPVTGYKAYWYDFIVGYSSAYFVSSTQTVSNWTSWGTLEITDEQPTNSSINYYIKLSTASDNFSTKSSIAVSNGQTISSTVGPYIQFIASMTRANIDSNPTINQLKINTGGANTNSFQGLVYSDRYYLALSTGIGNAYNNVCLCYQKNQIWTLMNNMFIRSLCFYNNYLMTGDSTATGYIQKQDISNLFNDNGNAYLSYYETKINDFGNPLQEKLLDSVWLTSKGAGSNLYFDYRLDGSEGDWTQINIDLSASTGINTTRINLPQVPRAYLFQYRFSDSGTAEDFSIRRIDSLFTYGGLR